MVWGVFSWLFWGSLVIVPPSLNAIRYVEILGDHLYSFMASSHPQGNRKFQQDNCFYHRSRLATACLDEHSYDLNPIEHFWDTLKKGVKTRHTTPATLTALWTVQADVFQTILVKRHRKLVESMPRCVAAVIKARGGQTRY